jgi:hypothetical protein
MRKQFVIQITYPNPFSEAPATAYIPPDSGTAVFNPCEALQFDTYNEAEDFIMTGQPAQNISIAMRLVSFHIKKIFVK